MLVAVVMVGMIAMLVVMVVIVPMVMRSMIVGMVVMSMMIMVIVTMIVVTMPVIVMRMIVVPMRMAGLGIGPAFGIERRLDLDHPRAKPLHHGFDDVIAADAQGFGHELRRQMAIAEVPGDADEMVRIVAADLEQRLGCRNHFDQPSVLQHQRIAAAQCNGILQVEQEFETSRPCHRHAAAVPIVEIEHDRIRRRFREAVLSLNLRRPDHALLPRLDLLGRDDFDLRRRRKALHRDTAERLHVLLAAMRHQRLGILPLLDEHHLGGIGDALMQIVGDIAGFLPRLLDAGGGGCNEFGARFGLDGQGGNDVDHEKSSRLFF
jgi:hypothetical protein